MRGAGEPRAHHFVPQCWLSGFTETGEKTGRLWVTDLKRRKQWSSNPENAGHRRDFYRTDSPGLDPTAFEKSYGLYESAAAPILKLLFKEQRLPTAEELEDLLVFMALQWVRVPAFRPRVLDIFDTLMRGEFDHMMESPETWARAMEKANIPPDTPGSSFAEMKAFHESGEVQIEAKNEFYLVESFKAMKTIVPALRQRTWEVRTSPSGSFIGSDNPVVLDGRTLEKAGFSDADLVVYPINKYVIICSTSNGAIVPPTTRHEIARINTLIMLWADEQLYSTAADFCWLDENDKYQTDWKLFDKQAILSRSALRASRHAGA